jgi:hypothetical protein
MVSSSKNYVVYDQGRIYHYPEVSSINYAQSQAACAALSFPGFTGTGYLVVWNTWVPRIRAQLRLPLWIGLPLLPAVTTSHEPGTVPPARRYEEQKMVESWFVKQRPLSAYWIGARQSFAPAGTGAAGAREAGSASTRGWRATKPHSMQPHGCNCPSNNLHLSSLCLRVRTSASQGLPNACIPLEHAAQVGAELPQQVLPLQTQLLMRRHVEWGRLCVGGWVHPAHGAFQQPGRPQLARLLALGV